MPSGFFAPGFGVDGAHEDLAEAGGDRPHRGLDAGRQLLARLLEALVDELAGEVDVRAVLEDDRDLRQAVARERARVVESRQAGHRGLDREGDALLDFERRVAGRLGVDLHLDVGDVRHGVDRQALVVVDAERGHAEHGGEHQPALVDGEPKNAVEHPAPQWSWLAPDLPMSAFSTKLLVSA